MSNFEVEKQKSEIRAGYYRDLVAQPAWQHFVKDMQEQIQVHKNVSVSFSQKNQMDDAKRQAWIIEGIEEALSRPGDVVAHHESFFQKVKQQICALCGNIMHRARA